MKQSLEVYCRVFITFFGLLFLSKIISYAAADSIFTIVPETQYVYLNHNVTFECATNLTGYTLEFEYGGSIDVTLKQTNLPDGGVKITTTFIVTSTNNGTTIRCHADNDGTNQHTYSSKVPVYAQDPPGAVFDFQGYQLDDCCIVFSWSPPFTLGQLNVWYQVTLSVGEEVMPSEVIYIINYTYCPIDLTNGEYRLNITTINGAGTGIWNSNTTMFKTNQTLNPSYNNNITSRQNNKWTYYFKLPLCIQPIINTTVMSCNLKNSSDCYNSTNVIIITDFNGNKTIVSKIDLPPKEKFTTCIFLEYESGQIFQTTPVNTSTHDLQGITVWNTSDNVLCLQFKLVHGRHITELHLYMRNEYKYYNSTVSHIRHLRFEHCLSDIPPGNNWTLYVCDGVLPNVSDTCSNPAVILTDINITGRISIEPSTTIIRTLSSSWKPTVTTTASGSSNLKEIAIGVGVAVGLIIAVIFILIVMLVIWKKCPKIAKKPCTEKCCSLIMTKLVVTSNGGIKGMIKS